MRRHRSRTAFTLRALTAVVCALSFTGCEEPLFPDNLPRNQYERYDRLRGRVIAPTPYNAAGVETPMLRERLSPYGP